MSNVVYILGAGVSADAGAPLMGNFLDTANDLLWSNTLSSDYKTAFEQVFRIIGKLQAAHSKSTLDLNNIESIFTVLELGKVIQKVPGLNGVPEIESIISSLKKLIVATLERRMHFRFEGPVSKRIIAHDSFREFAMRLVDTTGKSKSVITFNYDIGVDVAMYEHGLGPDYIVEKEPYTEPNNQIQLHKLHGSLNWANRILEDGRSEIAPLHIADFEKRVPTTSSSWGDIRVEIGTKMSDFFRAHRKGQTYSPDPVIVPPSWNKADYHNALTEVWKSAAANLSEAEYIFICGYSLPETDSFFRHLFALGCIGDKQLRRIAVFNPDKDVNNRFMSMLGPGALARYEFHAMNFEEAIPAMRRLLDGKKA